MNGIALYAVIFAAVITVISFIVKLSSGYRRLWKECAQRYRLTFNEAQEERNGEAVLVLRLKGYYRTCLISVNSIPSPSRRETLITVSYPKSLLNNLSNYPAGLLSRVSRGLTRQLDAPSNSPFFVTLPAGGKATETQKQLNPILKERLVQLMIACGGKGRQVEVTDAYVMCKQLQFMKDPEPAFPIVDEMIGFINLLETNVDDLLI